MSFQEKSRKANDWSLNLEDEYYVDHVEELVADAVKGVDETEKGFYVNLVTPAGCGDPASWLIPRLELILPAMEIGFERIEYVDQCGCGGFVTRVYR
ncbi:CGCGG family rSAM-modified RiPP protein [Brevibacillus sp. SYSU BS000544]|uniref:CGCGG family putative rSAM-modified RiPP protein n=1 Tax=Brevibacillus sp. SYSU BS000544 TaxID=3416443 RepID=UPI003CE52181